MLPLLDVPTHLKGPHRSPFHTMKMPCNFWHQKRLRKETQDLKCLQPNIIIISILIQIEVSPRDPFKFPLAGIS